jgi:hypothetical protein
MTDSLNKFPIPDGMSEVNDDYQLNLCHYELKNLKPKGTIIFGKDAPEIKFRFIAGEKREDGIFARLDEGISPAIRKILDTVERNPKIDCFVGLSLLQFKVYFFSKEVTEVKGGQHKTYFFKFPEKLLKTHRRKFIRIPFNDQFPAELRFQASDGSTRTCKLKDLSREGMRLVVSDADKPFLEPGSRLKLGMLKVINKEMSVGAQVVSHYPGNQVGLKIIAMSEEDKAWIKDCIRILMKQILNLPESPFGDVLEKDPGKKD